MIQLNADTTYNSNLDALRLQTCDCCCGWYRTVARLGKLAYLGVEVIGILVIVPDSVSVVAI